MISINDIHWIAGFLEGEGSFAGYEYPKHCNFRVTAAQKQKWPLEKLNSIISGKIYPMKDHNKKDGIFVWYTDMNTSAGLMMTIYPLMSPKRKEQIEKALFFWKIRTGTSWKYKTHCNRGHELNPSNVTINQRGTRYCRLCHNIRINSYRQKESNKLCTM